MPIDLAKSARLKSVTATDMSEKVLRSFAQIGEAVSKWTNYSLRTRYPVSDGERAQCASEETGGIVAATENVVANLTTTESFTVPVTAGVKVDTDTPIDSAASS